MPVPEGSREVDILGFSAGSYTGLAVHEVLNEFACFPGTTKVAAIASPPEMLRLATGETQSNTHALSRGQVMCMATAVYSRN